MSIAALNVSIFGRRRVRHIRQVELAECGLACLAMIASFYGLETSVEVLRRRFSSSTRGSSLRTVIGTAEKLGLSGRPVKLSLNNLSNLTTPAMLHWDLNHFVVLEEVKSGQLIILDPAAGRANRMSYAEASAHFTGIALELTPTSQFKRADERERLHLRQLWQRIRGWKNALLQTLILTFILQAFVLSLPYYMQIAVDQIVPTRDLGLLTLIAAGFAAFVVFNAAATLLRGFVLLAIGTTMSFSLSGDLARKLFRLPISWFVRRHVGDVVSRFQSVTPIKEALTQGLVVSLVDGILAILVFFVMLWYSPLLASISVVVVSFYFIVRAVSFVLERDAREKVIVASSREQTVLLETIRGISTIRLFGRETERHLLWQSRLLDATNAGLQLSKISLWQMSASTLLFGLESVLSVLIAVRLVVSGGFSVGMLFAFFAYKQQFLSRMSTLLDQSIAFRMLGLHLQRLAEIALAEDDAVFIKESCLSKPFSGEIELRNISFSYGQDDPVVIDQLSLKVPAGAHIAITGRSGEGKSTLAKILLGLLHPTGGEILIDKMPIEAFGYQSYRDQVAAVLQDDNLFSGSLVENISFFDENPDFDAVVVAAQIAAVHEEIMAMPMKYESLVGDMGSSLSGGQKARVLLARALYRKPKLLLLDEGTAHLDPQTESVVNEAIRSMGITRLVIAHRAETIRSADLVMNMINGRLHSV